VAETRRWIHGLATPGQAQLVSGGDRAPADLSEFCAPLVSRRERDRQLVGEELLAQINFAAERRKTADPRAIDPATPAVDPLVRAVQVGEVELDRAKEQIKGLPRRERRAKWLQLVIHAPPS